MRGQLTTNDTGGGGVPRPRTRLAGKGYTDRPQPLSVLMVIESYLPWTGGTERQLAALAAELGARNVRVEGLTQQGRPGGPPGGEIPRAGVRPPAHPHGPPA